LAGVNVEIWQCDATGNYSEYGTQTAQTYLRGIQTTDSNGQVTFTTIYPGWYQGRATHIHFKIRATASTGRSYEFTSQLFFDDALSAQIYTTQAPYAARGASGRTLNSQDGIYRGGGSQLLLAPTATADGYAAAFPIALQVP